MSLARAYERKLQSTEGAPQIYNEATSRWTQNIVGIKKEYKKIAIQRKENKLNHHSSSNAWTELKWKKGSETVL